MSGIPEMFGFGGDEAQTLKELPPVEVTGELPAASKPLEMQAEMQALLDSGSITDPALVREMLVEGAKKGMQLEVRVDPRLAQQQQQQAAEMERQAPEFMTAPDPTESALSAFDAEPFGAGDFAPERTARPEGGLSDEAALAIQAGGDYFRPDLDPEHGLSASNRRELFKPPFWEPPDNPATFAPMTTNRPYVHAEPSMRSLLQRTDLTEEQRSDAAENGRDSETYQRYADAIWGRVLQAHQTSNLPVMRADYLDEDTVGKWYMSTFGSTGGTTMSMLTGLDDMVSMGIGRQAVATAFSGADSPAVAALRAEGVLPTLADQMKDSQEAHPVAAGIGSLGGLLAPFGAGAAGGKFAANGAVGAGGKLLKLKSRIAPVAARSGVAAGAVSAGQAGVDAVGEAARGEEQAGLGPVASRVIGDAMVGTMFGGGAEFLGSAGRGLMARFRTGEDAFGGMLRATEAAPSMGGRRATGGMAGLRDTPAMAEARERVGSQALGVLDDGGATAGGDRVATVLDELVTAESRPMLGELARSRKVMDGALRAENAAYYASVEGKATVNTAPLVKTLLEAKGRGDRSLFGKSEVDAALKKLIHRVPVPKSPTRTLAANAGQVGEYPGLPNQVRQVIAEAPDNMQFIRYDGESGSAYFARKLNAEELDLNIGDLDDRLREYAKRGGGESRALRQVQSELRKLYGEFRPNAATGGRTWETVKGDHHQRMNRASAGEAAFGVEGVKRAEESFSSLVAMESRLKSVGADDTTTYNQMRDALRGDPKLQAWLSEIRPASMRAGYTGGQGGMRMTSGLSGGVPRPWVTTSPEKVKAHLMDPLASQMGMLAGRGGESGLLATENDFGSAAWHALKSAGSGVQTAGRALAKMYKMLDEIETEEGRVR